MEARKIAARFSARDQLWLSTQRLHDQVERQFALGAMSSTAVYSTFLLANWPLMSIEAALEDAGVQELLPDWEKRRRREALTSDLWQLGISPPGICPLTINRDRGALLGWVYVLEGSRLGASVILQAINRCSAAPESTHFLRHGEGEQFWKSFKLALSEIDGNSAAISNACASAKLAFQYILAAKSSSPQSP